MISWDWVVILSAPARRFKGARGLGVDIPLRSLFQASTVADMALAVTQSHAAQKGDTELESVLAELGAMPSEQVRKLLADQEYPRAS